MSTTPIKKSSVKTELYKDNESTYTYPNLLIHNVYKLKENRIDTGPVIYWMSRDQRFFDNWALLRTRGSEGRGVPLAVVFSLVPKFLQASILCGFMLNGLKDVQEACSEYNVPFHLLTGYPQDTLPKFVEQHKVSLIVTDMSPLRTGGMKSSL